MTTFDNPRSWVQVAPELTLRDWFAGMAMRSFQWDMDEADTTSERAAVAYEIADAMLRERTKGK